MRPPARLTRAATVGPIGKLRGIAAVLCISSIAESGSNRDVTGELRQQLLVCQFLERPRHLTMQLHPAVDRDVVVSNVSEQRMDERKANGPIGLAGDQPGGLGSLEGVDHRWEGAGTGRLQVGVEFRPDHGRQVEHDKVMMVEPHITVGKQCPERSRPAPEPTAASRTSSGLPPVAARTAAASPRPPGPPGAPMVAPPRSPTAAGTWSPRPASPGPSPKASRMPSWCS